MENTLENKAKFFALYWGQMIVSTSMHKEQGLQPLKCLGGNHSMRDGVYLILKPLSSISDEDALLCSALLRNCSHLSDESKISQFKDLILKNNFYTKVTNIAADSWLKTFDSLRSKGYALPWIDLSVEELVNRGWVKLKGESNE